MKNNERLTPLESLKIRGGIDATEVRVTFYERTSKLRIESKLYNYHAVRRNPEFWKTTYNEIITFEELQELGNIRLTIIRK